VQRVDSEGDASKKRFDVEAWCARHHLSARHHEQHGDGGMQANVDHVVSARRQTTHHVVQSAAIYTQSFISPQK